MKEKEFIMENEWIKSEAEDTDNFYDMGSLDEFVDDDVISSAEEGFMQGYLDA